MSSRKSARAPLGPMWDKPSLQEFDGRKNTNAGDEGGEGGKWNSQPRKAVIVSKWYVRTPGK